MSPESTTSTSSTVPQRLSKPAFHRFEPTIAGIVERLWSGEVQVILGEHTTLAHSTFGSRLRDALTAFEAHKHVWTSTINVLKYEQVHPISIGETKKGVWFAYSKRKGKPAQLVQLTNKSSCLQLERPPTVDELPTLCYLVATKLLPSVQFDCEALPGDGEILEATYNVTFTRTEKGIIVS